MTLIHGILSLTGDIEDNQSIKTMTESMQQYAPDGTAYWQQGNIALGANLLKTLPSNRHESNPVVTDSAAQLTIVADARIDNRDELCQLLSIDNSTAEALSDIRLILESYKKWGEQCAPKLIGDFAFVIWNQHNQSLFCCRDVFAIRPFYYFLSDNWFIFSSDLDPLLALDFIPATLDEGYIADQIGGLYLYENNTPYQEIDCLDAAHQLTIINAKPQFHHYWQPDLNHEIRYHREEQYIEQYHALFTESVKCRLASDEPVASFISGGLDASSISMVAAKILHAEGKQLNSFCHVLPSEESNPDEDEKALVQLLEPQDGLDVTWVSRDNLGKIPAKQSIGDYLMSDNPFFLTSLTHAQQRRCKVFLCGFGGDQAATFHAHGLTTWQLRSGNFFCFYKQIKTLAADRNKSILKIIAALLWHFLLSHSSTSSKNKIRDHLLNTCVYNPEFAKRIDVLTMAGTAPRFYGGNLKSLRESMWKDLSEGVNPHNKRAATHIRYQMEARLPMFDRRLVEFCLSVPPEQHKQGLLGRQLIRKAMKHILPDDIRLRHNKHYSSNPSILQYIADNIQTYKNILEKSYAIPEIAQYIDLNKIQTRLERLPETIYQRKRTRNKFKLGATSRALSLISFMSFQYKQGR